MAKMSRNKEFRDEVLKLPFYDEVRKAVPNDKERAVIHDDNDADQNYIMVMDSLVDALNYKKLNHLVNVTRDPYVNPYKNIGRNDSCPCGSGKKFKKCCARDR